MALLSLTMTLNANQTAYTVPLPICESITICPLSGGVLDIQQRTISLKDEADVNSVELAIIDNNGADSKVELKKSVPVTLQLNQYAFPVKVSVSGSSNPQDRNLQVPPRRQ